MSKPHLRSVIVVLALLFILAGSVYSAAATPPTPEWPGPPARTSPADLLTAEGVTRTLSLPAAAAQADLVPTNMSEDFEAAWPAAGWEVFDQSANDGGEYLWGKRDCHPHTGGYAGWSVGGGAQGSALACDAHYPHNARSWAIYGPFDLSTATSARLTFHLWGRSEGGSNCPYDFLFVGSSTDRTNFSGGSFCGDYAGGDAGNGYHRQALDLSHRCGESEVWVAFVFVSDGDTAEIGFTIDDVSLTAGLSTPPSLNLAWSSAEDDRAHSVAWGDYDGDGDLDLAVGTSSGPNRLYRNDRGTLTVSAVWSSSEADDTLDLAWGDVDGDGDLDLAAGNWGQPVRLYRNDEGALTTGAVWSSSGVNYAYSVAWGDYDGDGGLDLVVGNWGQNRLYRNDGGALTASAAWSSAEADPTFGVAWGDYDGDGDLDLAAGNACDTDPVCYPNRLYRNDGGVLTAGAVWNSSEADFTISVAWGDYDGDGDPDLAVGNGCDSDDDCYPNRLYRNDGGTLAPIAIWDSAETDFTTSVAWGDVDGDGDLDLAVGNYRYQPNRLYRNDEGTLSTSEVWSSLEEDYSESVAWGDVDGDGDLDLAVGNVYGYNRLYRNAMGTLNASTSWESAEVGLTESVAWGDYDGDGDLDLAVVNLGASNRLYRNDGGTLNVNAVWNSTETDMAYSVAWGDYDGDGDLDLVVGNDGPNRLYRNDGNVLTASAVWSSAEADDTRSIVWGDVDGDGDLDLAAGNLDAPGHLYRNDGGVLTASAIWTSAEADQTEGVAWGDYDGDGDLDLVAGNWGPNRLYRNDRGTLTASAVSVSVEDDYASSVAWGDYDADGDLDLAVGNHRKPNQLYRNDGGTLTASAVWSSVEADPTSSVAWGDVDSDGDLDLVVGNKWSLRDRLYRNDQGTLTANAVWASAGAKATESVAWGDVDGDGDLDLAVGGMRWEPSQSLFASEPVRLYRNTRDHYTSPSSIPIIALAHPGGTDEANFHSSSQVWTEATIPIVYTLFHCQGDPVREVRGFYSLNGGGQWLSAVPTADTITTDLASGPYPNGTGANTHVYHWDIHASGVMGQYDNVVFRLVAFPSFTPRPNRTVGPYQYGLSAATTFPFCLSGSQVRVMSGTQPVSNALIYRLPAGQTSGGALYAADAGVPFRTNDSGYLQGHGEINVGDNLLALAPIAWTESYTMYHTNGLPTPAGLGAHTVTAPGEQTLTVSAAHPLYLFNLDISLEWDAHNDVAFMEKLQFDLLRAAEHLYDLSDGQATLGEVYLFHDAENWQTAHLRIYANNRLRPNATLGGVISDTITDTLVPAILYEAGQIRMPAVWNRYGDPSGGTVGEDWPRTLAHEFGHYYFFLDDHYLGLDENGQVISIDTCTNTAMTDPYRYSEYRDQADWLPACADTLANHLTGRSDWQTISLFYPELTGPDAHGTNDGPALMPFGFIEITAFDPLTPTQAIADPTFYFLTTEGQRYQPAEGSRGFLLKENTWLLDVGEPLIDHILARGAKPGDRLCLFDAARSRLGCETIQPGDDQIILYAFPDWQPEIIVSPVATNTIDVTIHTADGLPLEGRIFSTDGPATEVYVFAEMESGTYTARMSATLAEELLLEGFVQIWVDEASPRREMITDYSIGASPGAVRGHGGAVRGHGGAVRGHGGAVRGHGGAVRGHGAPILSGDGQVTIYTPDPTIPDGEFLTIQAATGMPELPPGRVQIGQAYRIAATAGLANLYESSISFQYMGEAVPAGMEEDITIYYWNENEASWHALPTVLNMWDNFASAQVQGTGLYGLLTAFRVPLYAPGWNIFSYPLRSPQPVSEALVSISGTYTTVYGYEATDTADPWKVYDVTAPDYVNDLATLEFGRGYWINVSQAITMYFGATAEGGALSSVSLPPHVPATYYGEVLGGTAGETVTAWVGDSLCGQGQTLEVDSKVVYALNVMAEAGGPPGCGAPGRQVTFRVGSQVKSPTVAWDDSRLWEVVLTRPFRVYMPLTEGN
ncbi:MAG: VCBS repeat-containing protein [Chloroflexi bacterium]|nr:VCBS repeat-containing protein [Chloroflexota bacterium]